MKKPKKRAKRTNWKRRALLLREAIKLEDAEYDELETERNGAIAQRDAIRDELALIEHAYRRLDAKLKERAPEPSDRTSRILAALAGVELVTIILLAAVR
jgi:chromosome segregation ATPase